MRRAFIVIGANYGDEGKGLVTYSIARQLAGRKLNILINGGAQRGHTVDLPDGRRHVFHHFGSAALAGANSCADGDFIVNPLLFMDEYEDLQRDFALMPRLFVCGDCRVTLPCDMMLGQIIEENRGALRHGSCGLGIFETRLRYEKTGWALVWGKLTELSKGEYAAYYRRIVSEYIPERLRSLGMGVSAEWRELLADKGVMENSYEDLCSMRARTETYCGFTALAGAYDSLLFEAGQGLRLDEMNRADFPYLTPSRTVSLVSAKRIAALGEETEATVLYVTRAYLTRHGAGPLPGECDKARINPDMTDRTNVPNPHQQVLRYGMLDTADLLRYTNDDLAESRSILPGLKSAVAVTHLNETDGQLAGDGDLKELCSHFDESYLSFGPCELKRAEG